VQVYGGLTMTEKEALKYAQCILLLIETSNIDGHLKGNLMAIVQGNIDLFKDNIIPMAKLLHKVNKTRERF
jgi:hypothetical protein